MNRNDPALPFPLAGGCQTVSFSATSAATSNAVGDATTHVVLYATEDCHVVFGVTPTATTADFFMPSGTPIMLTIGGGMKVAARRATTNGTLYVSETTK